MNAFITQRSSPKLSPSHTPNNSEGHTDVVLVQTLWLAQAGNVFLHNWRWSAKYLEGSDSELSSISSDTDINNSVDDVAVIETIVNDHDSDEEAEAASEDTFIWEDVISLTELWIKTSLSVPNLDVIHPYDMRKFKCLLGFRG
jgi:hypothetical protein